MMRRTFPVVLVSLASVVGCDGGSSTLVEDERGSVGPANPAAVYCDKLGYRSEGEACLFPDGTSCEQWSFYRAACGQQHSYCNQHGGTVSSEETDSGGFTIIKAICTVDGKRCEEQDFVSNGSCG